MTAPWIRKRPLRTLVPLGILSALLALGFALLPAADHRDGPIFGPPGVNITNSRRDFNDIYVYQSPANANNTCFNLSISPFSTTATPAVFDQRITLDLNIVNRDLVNVTDDITFRITFGPPDRFGVQDVTLQGLPAAKFPPNSILAKGKTGQNIPVKGGGMFRAAEQDDPFFFDASGFANLINPPAANPLPRGMAATNFFANANVLAVSLEIPSNKLTKPGSNLIGAWVAVKVDNVQIDRMARPAINTALIPPVPRGSNNPVQPMGPLNRHERRNAFNAGHPKNDRRDFTADMVAVLQNFYGRTAADSNAIASLLLPDLLIFDVTDTRGFGTFIGPGGSFLGNGRRLRDDVIDVELTVLTNGAITSDNVPDDNIAPPMPNKFAIVNTFPYIGPRNASPANVPTGNPPPP